MTARTGKEIINEVLRLRRKGLKQREIAALVGISHSTVSRAERLGGAPRRRNRSPDLLARRPFRQPLPADLKRPLRRLCACFGVTPASKLLGLNDTTVLRAMRGQGVHPDWAQRLRACIVSLTPEQLARSVWAGTRP